MKKVLVGILTLLVFSSMSFSFLWFENADIKTKRKSVIAFVDEAVAYYQKNGEEKAFATFNDKDGGFQRGALYVFVVDHSGITRVHVNQKLVGKNVINLKDSKKKPFIKEFIQVSKEKGEGWVEYYWTHPVSKKVKAKISYVKRVNPNYFISAGVYKED